MSVLGSKLVKYTHSSCRFTECVYLDIKLYKSSKNSCGFLIGQLSFIVITYLMCLVIPKLEQGGAMSAIVEQDATSIDLSERKFSNKWNDYALLDS